MRLVGVRDGVRGESVVDNLRGSCILELPHLAPPILSNFAALAASARASGGFFFAGRCWNAICSEAGKPPFEVAWAMWKRLYISRSTPTVYSAVDRAA